MEWIGSCILCLAVRQMSKMWLVSWNCDITSVMGDGINNSFYLKSCYIKVFQLN